MNNYAFILGRKFLLSIAELCQFLGAETTISEINQSTLIAQLKEPLSNPQGTLDHLGGTIKIAEIFAELPSQKKSSIPSTINQYLIHKFQNRTNKVNYGVSVYNLTDQHEIFLKKTLIFLKKELRKAEIKGRFINNNFKNLENAAIKGEKLLKDGAEIIVIQGQQKIYIAETKALQDFENYSHRDYNRPARDAHLGMLPPKLAQIMINLAGLTSFINQPANSTKTIYDPFCGIGTVLTESLTMDYKVIGSDINQEAISKTEQNIKFILNKKNPTNQKTESYNLFTKDATTLKPQDLPVKIDAIVTESFLGPPVSQFPPPANIEKTFTNIRQIILGFMKAIYPLLKPGTPIIISLLVYRNHERFVFIEGLNEKIEKLGYKTEPLIPQTITQQHNLKLFGRPSLVYDRPDQIVGREIWKFIRQ